MNRQPEPPLTVTAELDEVVASAERSEGPLNICRDVSGSSECFIPYPRSRGDSFRNDTVKFSAFSPHAGYLSTGYTAADIHANKPGDDGVIHRHCEAHGPIFPGCISGIIRTRAP